MADREMSELSPVKDSFGAIKGMISSSIFFR
jgi:hypothetical protein